MTQQKILHERLLERSRDNYLFVYVQSFLRPSIFTFLLCNAATEYNFVKTLLLLTVSVMKLYVFMYM